MTARTFTATLPDGTVAKRSSKNRVYSHVVVIGPGTAADRAAALRREAQDTLAVVERFERAVERAAFAVHDRKIADKAAFHAFDIALVGAFYGGRNGTYPAFSCYGNNQGEAQTWQQYVPAGVESRPTEQDQQDRFDTPDNPRVLVDARALLIAQAVEKIASLRKTVADLLVEADRTEAGEVDLGGYSVLRWSSSADLAIKAQRGEYACWAERGHSVHVQPVN